jgi:hypothetical protein
LQSGNAHLQRAQPRIQVFLMAGLTHDQLLPEAVHLFMHQPAESFGAPAIDRVPDVAQAARRRWRDPIKHAPEGCSEAHRALPVQ